MKKFKEKVVNELKLYDRKDIFLFFGFIMSICIAIYSILTYGRTVINSDTASLATYVNCLNKEKTLFPATWNSVNGELWTLNMLPLTVGQILFGFIKSEALRRMMASVFQVVLAEVVIIWFSKKFLNNNSWLIICPLSTIFLWGAEDLILYQACYSCYYVWFPVYIFLFYEIFEETKEKKKLRIFMIIYSLLMIYSSMQGVRAYAEFILPLIFSQILLFCFDGKEERFFKDLLNKAIKVVCVVVPAIIGTVIYKWLCSWHNVNAPMTDSLVMPNSLIGVYNGFTKTIKYFFECFGYLSKERVFSVYGLRNIISIIMCIIICFVVPLLQLRKLQNENYRTKFFVTFAFAHNIIIFIYCVFGTRTMFYHVLSSVILFAFVSGRYIYVYWIRDAKLNSAFFWISMFLIAILISCVGFNQQSAKWKQKLDAREKIAKELLAHDLHKGYATFWNAYANEIYSDKGIKFCGVNIDRERLQIDAWLVDSDRYTLENGKTFVMLTDEEMESLNDRILFGYEVPIEEFVIEDVVCVESKDEDKINYTYKTNMNVFVYDGDYGSHIVDFFKDGELDAREMSFNFIGVRDENIITMNPDGIVYGPYAAIDPGEYNITIKGSNLDNCDIDIYSQNDPDYLVYSVESIGDRECKYKLKITKRVEDIQFMIKNSCLKNENNVEFWRIEIR